MQDYVEKDPWKAVSPENRLDFSLINQPLEALAGATINKIEREWPQRLSQIDGAQPLFALLSKLAHATYQSIRYLNAETPEDSVRKVEFVSSAPPLLRSLVDELFTIALIGADPEANVSWYYRSGWREQAQLGEQFRNRYGNNPEWTDWLKGYQSLLDTSWQDLYVTAKEKADPTSIRWWPTPAQMLRLKTIPTDVVSFFEYLTDWFYRQLSQQTHLTYPGLVWRGGTMLRQPDDPIRDGEWRKKRSDSVGSAVLYTLAFFTEVNVILESDLYPKCAYIWGVWKEYDTGAKDLFEMRYERLLAPKSD